MDLPDITPAGRRVAPTIDHTVLKPDVRKEHILAACRAARHYGFAAVCVHPARLPLVVEALAGSNVRPVTVAGFPFGAQTTEAKAFEAEQAVRMGARELDMVIAMGALKDGDCRRVADDIRAVVGAAAGLTVKVILETCLLTDEEKLTAARLAVEAGAQFVKTSTGFAGPGATVQDVRLLRKAVGPDLGVKASGGIRTLADALAMIEAGATRLGTSSGVSIVTQGPTVVMPGCTT